MPYTYPKALTAGTPENVNDLNTNLTGAAADWDLAFSQWKKLETFAGTAVSLGSASTWPMGIDGNLLGPVSPALNNSQRPIFPISPPAFSASPRTVRFRLEFSIFVNNVAPGMNFTVGLYPITVGRGSSGNGNTGNLGTVVSGSTVAFNTPPANGGATFSPSSTFTLGQGFYGVAVVTSGAMAAGSVADFLGWLEYQQS